jgi:hypothetical protein
LTALGAGNIPGAVSSLGSGLLGAGSNLIGGVGGSLYGGADQLLGGMLPNIGGVGITPAQGYMGNLFPNAVGQNPMFGGRAMQDAHIQAFNAAKGNMAHIDAYNAAQGGGVGGMLGKGLGALGKVGETAGAINAARNIFSPPGATQPGVYNDRVIQRNMQDQPSNKPIMYGGGQTPVNSSVNLSGQPQAMLQTAPMGASPAGAAYRDEISELVEEAMATKDNADRRRQSDSLKGTYGGRTTSLA